METLEKNRTS